MFEQRQSMHHVLDSSANAKSMWPGAVMHIALGGFLCAVVAMSMILPFNEHNRLIPIAYLLLLVGPPIGGLVYRFRSRGLPISQEAKHHSRMAIGIMFSIPLFCFMIVGFGAEYKANAIVGVAFLIAMTMAVAIVCCGNRRPRKNNP